MAQGSCPMGLSRASKRRLRPNPEGRRGRENSSSSECSALNRRDCKNQPGAMNYSDYFFFGSLPPGGLLEGQGLAGIFLGPVPLISKKFGFCSGRVSLFRLEGITISLSGRPN